MFLFDLFTADLPRRTEAWFRLPSSAVDSPRYCLVSLETSKDALALHLSPPPSPSPSPPSRPATIHRSRHQHRDHQLEISTDWATKPTTFWIVSSVRSSSVHHGLIEIQQQQQQGHFFRFFKIGAILPIYIHNSLSLSLSVQYTEQNQAILLHELHRMHVLSSRFYKVLQISLRPNICYIF